MDLWTIIFSSILFVLIYCLFRDKAKSRLPKGPTGFPLIGSLLSIDMNYPDLGLTALSQRYGAMFSMKIFGKEVIVLNDPDLIRLVFNSDAGAGRGTDNFVNLHTNLGLHSVSFSSPSPTWKNQRTLLHKALSKYGDGERKVDSIVLEELKYVISWIEDHKCKAINLRDIIEPSLVNIIAILTIGRRLEHDSPELKCVKDAYVAVNPLVSVGFDVVMSTFPFLRHIPIGFGRDYQDYQKATAEMEKLFFHDQKATYDPQAQRGLVDLFIQVQGDQTSESGDPWLHDCHIMACLSETLAAGVITSLSALMGLFLVGLHKPNMLRRMQEEIDRVIGRDRDPAPADRIKMPYTRAAIFEILRYLSVTPLALPHSVISDLEIGEYVLPKGSMVLSNIWAAHHDSYLWDEPWEFRPERFLDDNGDLVPLEHPSRRNFCAFGTGKRSCIGETFAIARMFMYLTCLLQRFHFRVADSTQLPSMDPRLLGHANTIQLPAFHVAAELRE